MNKSEQKIIAKCEKIIQKRISDVGEARDKIRDSISVLTDLLDNCENALADLESAADKLSELA